MSQTSSSRSEARRSRYKVAVDAEEGRRRREEEMVQVAKDRREVTLQRRRALEECEQQQQRVLDSVEAVSVKYKKLENLPAMVAGVWSNDGNMQLKATHEFREILSIGDEEWCSTIKAAVIEEVVQTGVVPRFVEFLVWEKFPRLQFEAAWVIANIASGTSENTKVVIDHGAVPFLVQLLGSPNDLVRDQAVWALGNIAGDSLATRDFILRHGALHRLVNLLNVRAYVSILRNATWVLANICRGDPHPTFDQIKLALPGIARIIYMTDGEIMSNACWTLYCISNSINGNIQAIIDCGVCPRLAEFLKYPSSALHPALETIKSIVVRGNITQIRYIINLHVLPSFVRLLTNSDDKLIKMVICYTIANITRNREFIQNVIDAGVIPPTVRLLQTAEYKIKKLCSVTISNCILCGSHEQVKLLVSPGCVKPLCDLISHNDPELVMSCLNNLERMLKVGETEKLLRRSGNVNVCAQMICDAGGFEKMESLSDHNNSAVYEKGVKILDKFFKEDGKDDI